jgi:hypothetical protein
MDYIKKSENAIAMLMSETADELIKNKDKLLDKMF